jgi:hypothetical protein
MLFGLRLSRDAFYNDRLLAIKINNQPPVILPEGDW